MHLNTTMQHLSSDPAAAGLVDILRNSESELQLESAQVYFDFPLYKDFDDTVVITNILVVSPYHGVITVGTSNAVPRTEFHQSLRDLETDTGKVFDILYARLIRNSVLKKTRTTLLFHADLFLYAPNLDNTDDLPNVDLELKTKPGNIVDYFRNHKLDSPISDDVFEEVVATIEGAKGLIRPKPRDITSDDPRSKANVIGKLETAIASFDVRQKHGYMTVLEGVERIRGLAGSGKTVVLAMKAAHMHLRNRDATILYTFYTKSLYQHIQRLITRFYRQFDDRDPDWDKLQIMHAWGGKSVEGVYYNACNQHNHRSLPYSEASFRARQSPKDETAFGYACNELLSSVDIKPHYDYVFVDEGQDFPNSFLRLCVELAIDSRMVYAYDELQTIFQTRAVSPSEFMDTNEIPTEDITLYKCYRNPREILVCAHALGFGIYGPKIIQMLENAAHWEDLGYKVMSGEFIEGSKIVIERPAENSIPVISENQNPSEIVQAFVYGSFEDEIVQVAEMIKQDITDGLRPDDILVIAVDDRNMRNYINLLAAYLGESGIGTNNMQSDSFGLRDFHLEECVTLSSVYKAKGNEAYIVYVMGVDALFTADTNVRERNILFTAMTRAKGWIRVSGIGEWAQACKNEIDEALSNFPNLAFTYPSKAELNIMKRDLADSAIRKQKYERMLDEMLDEMTPEEIKRLMGQRSLPKEIESKKTK